MKKLIVAWVLGVGLLGCPSPVECQDCLGCCDEAGRCNQGVTSQACGQGGATCQTCGAAQSCVLSACVAAAGGGAGGGAVTGGGGGAATGGGGGAVMGGGGGAVMGGGGGAVTGGGGGTVTGGGGGSVTGGGGGGVTGGGGTGDAGVADAGAADAGVADAGTPCSATGVACGTGAECCSTWCAPTGACAAAPAGETCASAIPFTFTNNRASVSGNTTAATEDLSLSCGGITRDVFYRFTLTTPRRVQALVSTFDLNFTPVVALLPAGCASEYFCTPEHEYGVEPLLQPGTYVLAVKSIAGSGNFTLAVESQDPKIGETCEIPFVFSPGAQGDFTAFYDWSASYGGYDGDFAVGCHLPGPTHVSTLTLQSRALVWFSFDDDGTAPRVALVGPTTTSACNQGPLAACSVSEPWLTTQHRTDFHRTLDAGTYFVFTRNETPQSETGDVYVRVNVSTGPVGEACQNPAILPPDGGHVTGTTAGRLNDSTLCGAAGRDTMHLIDLEERSYLDVTVTPTTGWSPTVALTEVFNYCSMSSFPVCSGGLDAGVAVTLPRQTLDPGPWAVFVDGLTATDLGPYALDVAVAPLSQRQGEVCLNPLPLTLSNDTVTVSGTTAGWSNDYRASCATGDGFADVVYSLTLATPKRITATVTGSTNFSAAITLSSMCAQEDLDCEALGSTVSTATAVPAGTYFIRVDGSRFASWAADGPYSLTVTVQ